MAQSTTHFRRISAGLGLISFALSTTACTTERPRIVLLGIGFVEPCDELGGDQPAISEAALVSEFLGGHQRLRMTAPLLMIRLSRIGAFVVHPLDGVVGLILGIAKSLEQAALGPGLNDACSLRALITPEMQTGIMLGGEGVTAMEAGPLPPLDDAALGDVVFGYAAHIEFP